MDSRIATDTEIANARMIYKAKGNAFYKAADNFLSSRGRRRRAERKARKANARNPHA